MTLLLRILHLVCLGSAAPRPAEKQFVQTGIAAHTAEASDVCDPLMQVHTSAYLADLLFHIAEDGDQTNSTRADLDVTFERTKGDSRDSTLALIKSRAARTLGRVARTLKHVLLPMLGPRKGDLSEKILQTSVPLAPLLLGSIVMVAGFKRLAMMLLYFGIQAGFTIYMKLVLSNALVSEALGYHGVPAAFAVTGIQQVVAFALMVCIISMLHPTSYRYEVKAVTTGHQYCAVLALATAFAANIGLHNLSMSYLPLSTVVMFRSCVPLITHMIQRLASTFQNSLEFTTESVAEVNLMIMGVLFAGICAVAQTANAGSSGEGQFLQLLGMLIALLSVAAAALNLVLVSYLGSSLKLNPVDTTLYSAMPAAVILFIIAFIPHPCEWFAFSPATDWAIVMKVVQLSPTTMVYILTSGILAGGYQVFTYFLVQTLSASHIAFAGNFTNAATIGISLLLGLEELPSGRQVAALMIIAITVNMLAFTAYSLIKTKPKHSQQADPF